MVGGLARKQDFEAVRWTGLVGEEGFEPPTNCV